MGIFDDNVTILFFMNLYNFIIRQNPVLGLSIFLAIRKSREHKHCYLSINIKEAFKIAELMTLPCN